MLKPLRRLQDILHPLLHRDILSEVFKHFVSENLACDDAGPIQRDLCDGDDLLLLDFTVLAIKLEPDSVEVRHKLASVLGAFQLATHALCLLRLLSLLLLLELLDEELIAKAMSLKVLLRTATFVGTFEDVFASFRVLSPGIFPALSAGGLAAAADHRRLLFGVVSERVPANEAVKELGKCLLLQGHGFHLAKLLH